MTSKIEKFANSKFMFKLKNFSEKLSKSPTFSTISGGMGSTMGLIMIGAVIQIITALGGMFFGWKPGNFIYDAIYMPYKLTMGMLGFFMCFSLAYSYSKRLKSGSPLQSGFIAIVCFLLVVAPPTLVTQGNISFEAMDVSFLGASGLFVAIIIGLFTVRISKFAIDHNWVIKMPDIIPEGVLNSFNSIIPAGLNIVIWYGLSIIISRISGGSLTLATLITNLLATPIGYLATPIGMVFILLLSQFFWFFGIHGSGVIFTAIMVPYVAAFTTNAELAILGQPLVFSAMFLYGANGIVGGTGNTLPLVLMGLKSKSKQIKSVCKASLVPSLFNINEPVIFGFPLMYNPILLIPFLLCPVVVMFCLWGAYSFGLVALPQVLILTCLPIGLAPFMSSLSWRNAIFPFVMLPICFLIYYPFFKIYEKQCIEREKIEELQNS